MLREHAIRDQDDYAQHMDCLHFNRVKHGYATAVAQWPRRFIGWQKRACKPWWWGSEGIADFAAGERR
jgi:putative transposase